MIKTLRMLGLMAMLCFIMPAFVSCDKDDDEPKKGDNTSYVEAVVGTYFGSLDYSVMNYEPGNIEGSYELKILRDAKDDDDVIVVIPQCSFTPPIPNSSAFTIPSITIPDVDVSKKGDTYIISEDDFSIDINGTTYSGKLYGTIAGKDAKVEYTLRPGRMPMDINFTFTGTFK